MSSSMWRVCAGVLLWVVLLGRVEAATGDWDVSYGVDGRMPLSIGGIDVNVLVWQPQADGRFVTAGRVIGPGNMETAEFLVARFNADGTPDVSFDGDGYLRFNWSGTPPLTGTIDLALLTDGRVLIAAQAGIWVRALRLNLDGSRDSTFGANGEVLISDPAHPLYNPRLALLPDGSAVIATMMNDWRSNPNIGLAKLTPAGGFDPSFGVNGRAEVDTTTAYGIDSYAIATLADGTIVLGGNMGDFSNGAPVVVRVTRTGQPDTTFGVNGIAELPFLSGNGFVNDVAIAADGKIFAVGERADSHGYPHHFVARLNRNGELDPTFGSGGRIIVAYSALGSVVAEPDGKVTVAGGSRLSGGDGLLARFNADGSPDVTFGLRGQSRPDFAVAPNSLLIVVRQFKRVADGSYRGLVGRGQLVRFLGSGASPGAISIGGASSYPSTSHYEGARKLSFSVYRSGGADGVVSVQYRVVGETATAGRDFVASTGTITFNDGETIKSDPSGALAVEMLDDSLRENDETFYVELFAPTGGARLSNSRITFRTIGDDDVPAWIAFARTSVQVVEGAGVARLFVIRSGDFSAPVSVNYVTHRNTANDGVDYTGSSGTISWAANEGGVRSIDVPLLDDAVGESNEVFNVSLSSSTPGVYFSNGSSASVHIADDDNAAAAPTLSFRTTGVAVNESASVATLEVQRLGNPAAAVSATWTTTAGNSATAGQDYTAASGVLNWAAGDATSRTVTIPILDDATTELAELLFVTISAQAPATNHANGDTAAVTIVDNEPLPVPPVIDISPDVSFSEGAGNVTMTVTLSSAAFNIVTASIDLASETAGSGDASLAIGSTLTWNPGDALTKVIPLTIHNDGVDEIDETFSISLSSPTGGASLGRASARVTLVDDDPTPAGQSPPVALGVRFEPASPSVAENARTLRMTVSRVGATDGVLSGNYAIVSQTASSQSDFVPPIGWLDWVAGDSAPKEIEIQLNGDMQAEPNETFLVRYSPRFGTAFLPPSEAVVTIVDDDQPGGASALVELVGASHSVNESATSVTLQVARAGNTSFASSVDFTTVAGTATAADFSTSSGTLTWQANDTSMKLITLTLTPDTADEPDESFTVQLSNASGGTQLGTAGAATVTIVDDDGAPSGSNGGGKGGGGGEESLIALLLWAALVSLRQAARVRERPLSR